MHSIQTVLITGIAGGVGGAVAQALLRHGYTVRGLARTEDDLSTLDLPGVKVFRGYVEDQEIVRTAIQDCDAVVNCAALLPNAISVVENDAFDRVNVGGSINVLRQAASFGLRKAFFFSTISVADHVGSHVTDATLQEYVSGSSDPYLNSKIKTEQELEKFAPTFPGSIHVIRPAFIYGPRNFATWRDGLELVKGGKMSLIGDGKAPIPLIFADDIGEFVAFALRLDEAERSFSIHILSNPEKTTLASVFDFIADQLNRPRPKRVPYLLVKVAADLCSLLPQSFLFGRLKLLTKARVQQYSKGYDMTGVNCAPLGCGPKTSYKIGIPRMIDDYFNPQKAKSMAEVS